MISGTHLDVLTNCNCSSLSVTGTCHSCTRPLPSNVLRLCWWPAHVYPPAGDSCITMYGYAESFVLLFAGNIAALSQFVPKLQLFSLSSISELPIQWCAGRPGAAIYASHWRSFNQVFRVPTTWLKPTSAPCRAYDCVLESAKDSRGRRRQNSAHLSLAPEKRAESLLVKRLARPRRVPGS